MAYASVEDLLTSPYQRDLEDMTDPGSGQVDEAALARALGEASAEIDAYLGGQMVLPLTSPPAYLKVLACDIAIWRLAAGLPKVDIKDAEFRYEKAVSYLRRVAAGEIPLVAAGSAAQEIQEAVLSAAPRLFTATSLRSG